MQITQGEVILRDTRASDIEDAILLEKVYGETEGR
jgi:hypothetical protein